jgi:hypothetical protein
LTTPRLLLSILVAVFALTSSPAMAQQESRVTVEGILIVGEFFGPPNYGEDPMSDRLEQSYILQLPAPLPTQMAKRRLTDLEIGEDSASDYFLQLVVADEDPVGAKALIGKRVRISGVPFRAETGHRTKTVVQVKSLAPIQSWSWEAPP